MLLIVAALADADYEVFVEWISHELDCESRIADCELRL